MTHKTSHSIARSLKWFPMSKPLNHHHHQSLSPKVFQDNQEATNEYRKQKHVA